MSNVASERLVNGIKTRVLHGKDYVEVAERVRIAHSGEIQFEQVATEHFSIESRWFVRCVILVNEKRFIGTAEIKFTAPKNTPDGTNPFECAETSALGRALAFAGLGTVESIASFDEVYRVQSIEAAEMSGRPVIEAAQPRQIAAPAPAARDLHDLTKPGSYEQHHRNDAAPEPDIVIDNLKARLLKVKQRAFDSGIKTKGEWAAFRKQYAEVDSDEALTVVGLAKMDGELTKREKIPA